MTFKNKFEDSETMRNLVKSSYEKGIFKDPSNISNIIKRATATPEVNLEPSDNVQENLLKLCAGLRAKGFAAYADKVEDRIVQIKMAEVHLYNVHGETGEDLLEFAHPEGSPEVAESMDSNGKVEDLIEKHKKILDVAEKSAAIKASVIEQVKLALSGHGTNFLVSEAAPRTAEQVAMYNKKLDNVASLLGQISKRLSETYAYNEHDKGVDRATRQIEKMNGAIPIMRSEVAKGDRTTIDDFLTGGVSSLKELEKYCDFAPNSDDRDTSKMDAWTSDGVFKSREDGNTAKAMIAQVKTELAQIRYNLDNASMGQLMEPPVAVPPFGAKPATKPAESAPAENATGTGVANPQGSNALSEPVSDWKKTAATFANKFKSLLDKEDAIYGPVPDNDTAKIAILDQAFDRAEAGHKDMNELYKSLNAIKEVSISKKQLEDACKSLPIFRGKSSFDTMADFVTYSEKVYQSVLKAVGLAK